MMKRPRTFTVWGRFFRVRDKIDYNPTTATPRSGLFHVKRP
jgi:hypothetical protein